MIRVRRARLDDARRIRDLHVRSIRVLCRPHYTPRQIAAWSGGRRPAAYRRTMASRRQVMFVAEDRGRLVGFASIGKNHVYAVTRGDRARASGRGSWRPSSATPERGACPG